jgi:hypothetical protein
MTHAAMAAPGLRVTIRLDHLGERSSAKTTTPIISLAVWLSTGRV